MGLHYPFPTFAPLGFAALLRVWEAEIDCPAPALIADGDWYQLDDGYNPPVRFEFDKVPNGVAPGNVPVDISAAATADDVAAALANAIATEYGLDVLDVNATHTLVGKVSLVYRYTGILGNRVTLLPSANLAFPLVVTQPGAQPGGWIGASDPPGQPRVALLWGPGQRGALGPPNAYPPTAFRG